VEAAHVVPVTFMLHPEWRPVGRLIADSRRLIALSNSPGRDDDLGVIKRLEVTVMTADINFWLNLHLDLAVADTNKVLSGSPMRP